MNCPDLMLELRSFDEKDKEHCHDHHQFVLPIAGSLSLDVENDRGEVSAKRAAVISAGRGHRFAASGKNCFLVADVPDVIAPGLGKLPVFIDIDPALSHYTNFAHHQLLRGRGNKSAEHQMLLLLVQLLQERHGAEGRQDRRVGIAKAYLDEHFQEKVSITDLAVIANLSIRQLNHLFRSEVGMTPHQYLTDLRMQYARCLLNNSGMSVQAVSEQVGYGNLAAFSDRFSKHFGHPPSHLRRITK